jgi:hypothetical protein
VIQSRFLEEKTMMMRLIVTLFVFAVLACGGSDTDQTGAAGGAAAVGGSGGERATVPDMPEPSVTVDPRVQGCLDLIRQAKFQDALPVCLAALKGNPGNQQLKDAVDKARAETAKRVAAQAASQAAGEGAAEGAASKLGEATGGMADKLGR